MNAFEICLITGTTALAYMTYELIKYEPLNEKK